MARKLKIYFHAVDVVGRINSCVGMAQALAGRGHHITFLTVPAFKDHYRQFGFEEILLPVPKQSDQNVDVMKMMAKQLLENGILSNRTPLEKALAYKNGEKNSGPFEKKFADALCYNPFMVKVFAEDKPDVIVVDHYMVLPAIVHSAIPWVRLESANVLILFDDDNLPPFLSGKLVFQLKPVQISETKQSRFVG